MPDWSVARKLKNNIFTITFAELENINRWLFEIVTDSMDVVSLLLTENEVSVPCIPKYSAGILVPYSFAGNLRLLLEYARGRKKLSRAIVEKITVDFYRLMNYSPMSLVREREIDNADDLDDDNSDDEKQSAKLLYDSAIAFVRALLPRSIAVIILGANARVQVELQRWIDGDALEALTGISPENAEDHSIQKRTDAEGCMIFDPVAVRAVLLNLETKEFH